MSPCAQCGSPLLTEARFCCECGSWVVAAVSAPVPRAVPPGVTPTGPRVLPAPPRPSRDAKPVETVNAENAQNVSQANFQVTPASSFDSLLGFDGTLPAAAAAESDSSLERGRPTVTSGAFAPTPYAPEVAPRPFPPPHVAPPPVEAKPSFGSGSADRVSMPPIPMVALPRDEPTLSLAAAQAAPGSMFPERTPHSAHLPGSYQNPQPNQAVGLGSRPVGPLSPKPRTLGDVTPASLPSRSVGRTSRPLGAFLVSFQYEPLGKFWPLGRGQNLVGRGGGKTEVDVGIGDTTVSSSHAIVEVDVDGRVRIEDRGSTNGTFCNGQQLAKHGSVYPKHGDRLRFGSFETILVIVPYSPPP